MNVSTPPNSSVLIPSSEPKTPFRLPLVDLQGRPGAAGHPLLFPANFFSPDVTAQLKAIGEGLQAVANGSQSRADFRQNFEAMVDSLRASESIMPEQLAQVAIYMRGAGYLAKPTLEKVSSDLLWVVDVSEVQGDSRASRFLLAERELLFRKRFGDAFADQQLTLFNREVLPQYVLTSASTDHAFAEFAGSSSRSDIPLTCVRMDVAGFTRKTTEYRYSPDDHEGLMDKFQNAFNECCNKYGLFFNKSMGDGYQFIAYGDNHETRAVMAALEFRDWCRVFNASRRARGEIEFGVRLGVSTGRGRPSPRQVGRYVRYLEVQGSLMVDASRVEGKCPENEVLVAQSTWAGCGDRFGRGDSLVVAGKSDRAEVSIDTTVVTHVRPAIQGLQDRRFETPMVDRVEELAAMKSHLASTLSESVASTGIFYGSGGIGKSRLLHEFRNSLNDFGIGLALVEGQGVDLPTSVANRDFVSLFTNMFNLAGLSPERMYRRLSDQMTTKFVKIPDAEQLEHIQLIATFLGVPIEESLLCVRLRGLLAPNKAEQLRIAQLESLSLYFDALLDTQPIVMLLDDLQWFDTGSLAILAELKKRFSKRQLFIVAAVREERERNHGGSSGQHDSDTPEDKLQKELKGLFKKGNDRDRFVGVAALKRSYQLELLEKLTPQAIPIKTEERDGAHRLKDPKVREKILEEARGIPLHIIELSRAVRDFGWKMDAITGGLTSADGNQSWDGTASFMETRLNALSQSQPEAYAILMTASVISGEFTQGDLEQLGVGVTGAMMIELVNGGLLLPVDREQGRYRFSSDQLRDVTYQRVGTRDRVALHNNYLRALDVSQRADLATRAHHLEKSNRFTEAFDAYYQAAEEAFHKKAVIEVAAALYERAHVCAEKAKDRDRQWKCLRGWDEALFLAAQYPAQEKVYALAHVSGQGRSNVDVAAALFRRGRSLNRQGKYAEAGESYERAKDLIEGLESSESKVVLGNIFVEAGFNFTCRNMLSQAEDCFEKAQLILDQVTDTLLKGRYYVCKNIIAGKTGNYSAALDATQNAREIFLARKDERRAVVQQASIGAALMQMGRYPEAEKVLNQAIALVETEFSGKGQNIHVLYCNLGRTLFFQGGKLEKAIDVLERAKEKFNNHNHIPMHIAYLVACYIKAGLLGKADNYLNEMGSYVDGRANDLEAIAFILRAQVELRKGNIQRALELSSEAVKLYRQLDGKISEFGIEILHTHSDILYEAGDRNASQRLNFEAYEKVQAAAKRLDPTHRDGFLLNIPLHQQIVSLGKSFLVESARQLTPAEEAFLKTVRQGVSVPPHLPPELANDNIDHRSLESFPISVGRFTQAVGSIIELHPIEVLKNLLTAEVKAEWIPSDLGDLGAQIESMRFSINDDGRPICHIKLSVIPERGPDSAVEEGEGLLKKAERAGLQVLYKAQERLLQALLKSGHRHQDLEVELSGEANINNQGIVTFVLRPTIDRTIDNTQDGSARGLLGHDQFGFVKVSLCLTEGGHTRISLATETATYTGKEGLAFQYRAIEDAILGRSTQVIGR